MKRVSRIYYYLPGLLSLFIPARVLAAGDVAEDIGESFNSFLFGRQILFGTFLGFLIGFTLKKSLKLLLYLIGVLLIIMIALNKFDLLVIKWDNIQTLYNNFMMNYNFSELFDTAYNWFSASIAVTGSFGVGFFIGIKVG